MKINVRKLIQEISKYDYITIGRLVCDAEQVATVERIEKENEEYQKSF